MGSCAVWGDGKGALARTRVASLSEYSGTCKKQTQCRVTNNRYKGGLDVQERLIVNDEQEGVRQVCVGQDCS